MEDSLLNTIHEKIKAKFADTIVSAEHSYDFPVFVIKREKIQSGPCPLQRVAAELNSWRSWLRITILEDLEASV